MISAISGSGFVDTLNAQSPVVVALAAFLFMTTETSLLVGLIVPGDIVVLILGVTADSPAEYLALVVLVVLGAMTGETAGYLIGRGLGPRIRTSRPGRRFGEDRWAHAGRLAAGHDTRWALVTSRFVPVLHSVVPVLAGTLAMPYRRFIAWEAVACTAWAAIYVGIGALVGGLFHDHGSRIGHGVSTALVLLILTAASVSGKARTR